MDSSAFVYYVEQVKQNKFPSIRPVTSSSTNLFQTPKSAANNNKSSNKEDESGGLLTAAASAATADSQSIASSTTTTTTTVSRSKQHRANTKSIAATPIGVRTKTERIQAMRVGLFFLFIYSKINHKQNKNDVIVFIIF